MRPPKRDGAAFSCDTADLAAPTVTLEEGGLSYAFVTQKLTGPDAPVGRPDSLLCLSLWRRLRCRGQTAARMRLKDRLESPARCGQCP
eukprot:COSAG04_NODE_891_length_9607_cov_13.087085_2_plen_88_part_00